MVAWDRLVDAAERSDGGAAVLHLPGEDPLRLFQRVAGASGRIGFVPVLATAGSPRALPAAARHRHCLVVCADAPGRRIAVDWLRELACASPRRHLLALMSTALVESAADEARPPGASVRVRLARADRWHRQGRVAAATRWLRAAAEAARRRGDAAAERLVRRHAARCLLDTDRVDEAARLLQSVLREGGDWPAYAEAAALWTDVLIARLETMEARAWVNSAASEAELRGRPVPAALRARQAELDFWQGRASGAASLADDADPDEAGWSVLCAAAHRWSGDRAHISAAVASRAGDRGDRGFWGAVLSVLEGVDVDESERRRRIAELDARAGRQPSARRRRLAAVVTARTLAATGEPSRARALLDALAGPGPEACAGRGASGRTASGSLPGLAFLTVGRASMHLDGLSQLLSIIEDAEDDGAALAGGCRWLCRAAGASAVAVVPEDRRGLLAAVGWRQDDLRGEIAAVLSGPARDVRVPGHDERAPAFGVSIKYSGVVVATLVVRGDRATRPGLQEAAHAVAALCAPAVRARLDQVTAAERAGGAPEIVGASPLIDAVRQAVTRAAAAPFPVLIEGESGTGKELVARALHRLSARRDRRFCAINCAALTDELVEAELFGHTRGAFTGAVTGRSGMLEDAQGGTLFLDEVADLSPRAQAKLLRVLQEREIRRVGENISRPVDIRVIAATNVPLGEAVSAGRFRNDLRFRLAVIRIMLPPLRDRVEDVPVLARAFWRRAAAEAGTRALLGADALARLARHRWPGNVRELQNAVAGLVVAAPPRGRVTARHVDQVLAHASSAAPETVGVPLEAARRSFERRIVAAALVRHAGRRHAAAAELGLTRQGLTKALRRLGLSLDDDAAGVA